MAVVFFPRAVPPAEAPAAPWVRDYDPAGLDWADLIYEAPHCKPPLRLKWPPLLLGLAIWAAMVLLGLLIGGRI